MKRLLLAVALFGGMFAGSLFAGEKPIVNIEVLYMNHGPMRPVTRRLQEIFDTYGEQVQPSWYDFESKEGEAFKKAKGVTAHVPCIIWVNGQYTVVIDGEEVTFYGFPTGAGPASFQGKWTYDDLQKAIDAAAGK